MKALVYDKEKFLALYSQDIQQAEMARLLEMDRTTVQRIAKRLGLPPRSTGPKRGERHPEWKGGRRQVGNYWYVYAPDHPYTTKQRYVAEHRLVMEKKLGRYLLPSEVVHHKQGFHNDPDNLELYPTNAEHLKSELTGQVPQWTPEGKERMAEGQRQRRIREKLLKLDG